MMNMKVVHPSNVKVTQERLSGQYLAQAVIGIKTFTGRGVTRREALDELTSLLARYQDGSNG